MSDGLEINFLKRNLINYWGCERTALQTQKDNSDVWVFTLCLIKPYAEAAEGGESVSLVQLRAC